MILLANKRDVLKAIEERSDPRVVKLADEIVSEIARIIYNRDSGIVPDIRDDEHITRCVEKGKHIEIAYILKYPDAKPSGIKEFDVFKNETRIDMKHANENKDYLWPIRIYPSGTSTYEAFYECAKKKEVDYGEHKGDKEKD